jgi:hypothetical protein
MRVGTTVSLIAHAALVAWGVLSIATPHAMDAREMEAVPIDLVEIGDVTAAPKPPATAPKASPAPPATSAAKVAVPLPQPKPQPQPAPPATPLLKAEPGASPSQAANAPPATRDVATAALAVSPPKPRIAPATPTPQPKPAPAKPLPQEEPFDIDKITAILDKPALPSPRTMASASGPLMTPPDAVALNSLIASTAIDTRMTVNELDALRSRIAQCWSPPPGWSDPSEVRVVMIISLEADGSVATPPRVVESPAGRYQVAAPESAVRAVRACAPYPLPAEKYPEWKEVKITFDPRAMALG